MIFYLLFELQSKVDFQMPFRLLEYMLEIWRDYLKGIDPKVVQRKEYKLPVIVPMVLYNGLYNWTACRGFKETLDGADLFGEYVADFKYILVDIQRYSQELLVGLTNLIGTVFLLDRQTDFEEFNRRYTLVKPVLDGFDDQRSRAFLLWFINVGTLGFSDEERKKLIGDIDVTKPKEVKKMISYLNENLKRYYNEAILKGKREGIKEGIKEGTLKGRLETAKRLLDMKLDIKLVSEATGLTSEEIDKLKPEA